MSRTPTRWMQAPVPEGTDALAEELQAASLEPALAPLLARRGVMDLPAAQRFLEPTADALHAPRRLADLDAAVATLQALKAKGGKVAVVGDYDVDGVSATALLKAVFEARGLETLAILPHRMKEGYGFQPIHAQRAAEAGCGLVVTADCGTTAIAAAEAALELGLGVIVTDHHLPGAPLPPGVLHINPKRDDCSYPFDELSGAGLALKLAQAFAEAEGQPVPLERLLRIACLGTIADLVPLVGENRAIAALGLTGLGTTPSKGLRALMHQSRVQAPLSAADIGFRLGPRINAAGRLGSADTALELLLTRDPREAARLAEQLDRWNRQRQGEEQRVVEEATEAVEARGPVPPVIVAWSPNWHRGVLGIAAGRLARDFHRPTLLLALEDGRAVGSGRSVGEVHLHGFLSPWRPRLERFGGHAKAVGLTVLEPDLAPLRQEWEDAATQWPEEWLERHMKYELSLEPSAVTEELYRRFAALEPHGEGNRQPLLRVGPMELTTPLRIFGRERNHAGGRARGSVVGADLGGSGKPRGDGQVNLLGWRWAQRRQDLEGRFEVLAYLEWDDYRGEPTLRLVDARPATDETPAS